MNTIREIYKSMKFAVYNLKEIHSIIISMYDCFGEKVYLNVPYIYESVNRERWIQQWTNGVPTQYLVSRYVKNMRRSPLLKWNTNSKHCETYIGSSLWNGMTCHGNVSKSLVLDEYGNWNSIQICERCINLLFSQVNFDK